MHRLTSEFYERPSLEVAQSLLGKLLVRQVTGQGTSQRLSGIIVEVEAYLGQDDSASHSFRGMTRRNAAMFMRAGTLYVYTIHAKYCLNVVTERESVGAAVLIRALEPWEGMAAMQDLRNQPLSRQLCSGPARLCQALSIDTRNDRTDLTSSDEIWLEESPTAVGQRPWQLTRSPRIGISSAQEKPHRLFIDGHQCVSGLARLHCQKRTWTFGNLRY